MIEEAPAALSYFFSSHLFGVADKSTKVGMKDEFGLTYVFISHDLNVVRCISNRVMVMYLGQVVEIGDSEDLFNAPRHPYTRALLSSIPSMDPDRRTEVPPLAGDPPNPSTRRRVAAFTPVARTPRRCVRSARRCWWVASTGTPWRA